MNNVKVDKEQLFEAINKNLKKHLEDFAEAKKEYVKARIQELRGWATDLETGRSIPGFSALQEPVSHAKEYQAILEMLRLSVDTQIVLDQRDFTRYVLDQWEWSDGFNAVTAMYKKAK